MVEHPGMWVLKRSAGSTGVRRGLGKRPDYRKVPNDQTSANPCSSLRQLLQGAIGGSLDDGWH